MAQLAKDGARMKLDDLLALARRDEPSPMEFAPGPAHDRSPGAVIQGLSG
ncbi:hypothetical protein [Paractinoplanes lichenicola]|uniref:Uncharacterized protein n=1 Tax=Paractinoplanes lichenicola TaxID=2802976 RepID=A0ABS1VR69_9ACTN|nr:hypothetical protein [Actinoplanes lichenicola]MBL7257216.1 hypothetical protein [Actinoplanes lichenicola]